MAHPQLIRQQVIDRCLGSPRRYSLKDLMEACAIALEQQGYKPSTAKNTILDDIRAIEAQYPEAIVKRTKVNRIVYYEYENKPFSIYKIPLNDNEMAQLAQTLSILSRFEGMPNFEWMDELIERFKSTLNIPTTKDTIVSFDENYDLKGRNWFATLFNAIASQQALEIIYQPFKQEPETHLFHPHLLKQFNNRWFLFGREEGYNSLTSYALDRIMAVKQATIAYRPNNEIDFENYFYDMVGVSRKAGQQTTEVHILIDKGLYPYIETKPIHGTQKLVREENGDKIVKIEVILNRELKQLLQSYGSGVTVLSPDTLRQELEAELNKTLEKYQSVQTN